MSTTDSNNYSTLLEWTSEAICKDKLSLFFPPFGERPQTRRRREAEAKQICAQCPVMIKCRDYARLNTEYGIWGGESEVDREGLGYILPLKYVAGSRKIRKARQESDHKDML